MGLIGKIKKKIKDIYSSDDISEKEYERYLELYNSGDDDGMNMEEVFWSDWDSRPPDRATKPLDTMSPSTTLALVLMP